MRNISSLGGQAMARIRRRRKADYLSLFAQPYLVPSNKGYRKLCARWSTPNSMKEKVGTFAYVPLGLSLTFEQNRELIRRSALEGKVLTQDQVSAYLLAAALRDDEDDDLPF